MGWCEKCEPVDWDDDDCETLAKDLDLCAISPDYIFTIGHYENMRWRCHCEGSDPEEWPVYRMLPDFRCEVPGEPPDICGVQRVGREVPITYNLSTTGRTNQWAKG